MNKINLNKQTTFIVGELLLGTIIIATIAFFAVNNIQDKMDRTYSEFAQTLTKTYALEYEKIKLEGRVVIVGAGGVARIFAYESVVAGCATVIATRPTSLKNAANLVGDIKSNTMKVV